MIANPCLTKEIGALEKLERILNLLVKEKPENRMKIANLISDFANKSLSEKKMKLSEEVEEILIECLDLNHWDNIELPPTLTIKEIRDSMLPNVKRIVEAKKSVLRIKKDF